MKNEFQNTIKSIEEKKIKTIKKLILLSFKELYELKSLHYELLKTAKEKNNDDFREINSIKLRIVYEAIDVKTGNEEEVWDSLT